MNYHLLYSSKNDDDLTRKKSESLIDEIDKDEPTLLVIDLCLDTGNPRDPSGEKLLNFIKLKLQEQNYENVSIIGVTGIPAWKEKQLEGDVDLLRRSVVIDQMNNRYMALATVSKYFSEASQHKNSVFCDLYVPLMKSAFYNAQYIGEVLFFLQKSL